MTTVQMQTTRPPLTTSRSKKILKLWYVLKTKLKLSSAIFKRVPYTITKSVYSRRVTTKVYIVWKAVVKHTEWVYSSVGYH